MADADRPDERSLLLKLFEAAVAAADPVLCVPANLPDPPKGRTIVIEPVPGLLDV